MHRRLTLSVMTLGLLLGLARVSHGQTGEGCPTPSFSQPAGSPVGAGDGPQSVAVGDFNRDGTPDLVTANFNSHNVTILLGDGRGGFTHPSSSPVDVGDSPRSVAVGDFNRDGRSDLAVANGADNNVTILLSFVGVGPVGGGFTEPSGSPVGVGTNPHSVAVGDLSPVIDSRPDLAVANSSDNNVTILLGVPPPLGMGGFAPAGPFGVGVFPLSVAVGDFNLVTDSWSDLAVANQGDNNVTILLGNGMGGFTPASGSPVGVGDSPGSVAVGDFNRDGTPDLAVANQDTDDVTILVNTCSNAPPTDTFPR